VQLQQLGDLALCDIFGAMNLGYRTCYYRTRKISTAPTAKEIGWYKKAYDELMLVCEAIKPGSSSADIAEVFKDPHSLWLKGRNRELW
jgi:hypothetical protein